MFDCLILHNCDPIQLTPNKFEMILLLWKEYKM